MPEIPIPITVIVRSDGVDVNPTYAFVRTKSDQDVFLQWTVVGGTFPTSGCVTWKTTGAPSVSCPSESGGRVIRSATYRNTTAVLWRYSISIIVGDKTITIDPEINNEPPSGF